MQVRLFTSESILVMIFGFIFLGVTFAGATEEQDYSATIEIFKDSPVVKRFVTVHGVAHTIDSGIGNEKLLKKIMVTTAQKYSKKV